MKSITKDQTQEALHKITGKIKDFLGITSMDSESEGKGKDENTTGEVPQKTEEVKNTKE